jgi:hypothetical protein
VRSSLSPRTTSASGAASTHVEAPWKRQTAADRSRYVTFHRSPSGSSDRRQQTAAAARALQAGGRPFEPGTAHPRDPRPERNVGHRQRVTPRRKPSVEARLPAADSSARRAATLRRADARRELRAPAPRRKGPRRRPKTRPLPIRSRPGNVHAGRRAGPLGAARPVRFAPRPHARGRVGSTTKAKEGWGCWRSQHVSGVSQRVRCRWAPRSQP